MTAWERAESVVALVLLGLASAMSAVLAAAWLTARVGPVPVPFTAVLALLFVLALTRLARQWSDTVAAGVVPAVVFVATIIALGFGPGANLPVPLDLRGLLLVTAGGIVPLWWAVYGGVMSGSGPTRR